MSQSERIYVSQQSRLEYLTSSVQYSISNSLLEDFAKRNFWQNQSRNILIGAKNSATRNVNENHISVQKSDSFHFSCIPRPLRELCHEIVNYAKFSLESSAHLSFQPSYSVALRTTSPALYGSSPIYTVTSRFTPQGYDLAKEYTRFQTVHTEYHFIPENFIRPGKEGAFIGDAEQIKPFVEETFQRMFNIPFPNHINVSVLNKKEFQKIAPHPGTIGLSLNRTKHGGISEIFVLQDSLARVMLTLGHELGHVLTETLSDQHDEEAKAYAFSLAWMKCVKDNNIANLEEAIVLENPAHNGLHNVSFAFVQKILDSGRDVWRLYLDLIQRNERVMSDSLLSSSL